MDVYIVMWKLFRGPKDYEVLTGAGVYGAALSEQSAMSLAHRRIDQILALGHYDEVETISVSGLDPPPMDIAHPGTAVLWSIIRGKSESRHHKCYVYVTKTRLLDSPLELLAAQAE